MAEPSHAVFVSITEQACSRNNYGTDIFVISYPLGEKKKKSRTGLFLHSKALDPQKF